MSGLAISSPAQSPPLRPGFPVWSGLLAAGLHAIRTAVVSVMLAGGVAALVAGQAHADEIPPATTDDLHGLDLTNPLDQRRIEGVLSGLEERARLVRELLDGAARALREVAIKRSAAERELQSAEERLDREAVQPRDLSGARLDELVEAVDAARGRIAQLRQDYDRRLADLGRLVTERDALGRRVADLRSALPAAQQLLTGTWEVTWMPAGISGTFYFDQSGALVTGQYKLGSVGSGSLQGTFVRGKLYLQRIDSTRGRDAELEGLLDADGTRIRGTWQAYELVQGGLPRGQWVARRVK